jgi:ABC-type oligopeptide transport system ATPase subunit
MPRRQRICIARALALNPKVVIADKIINVTKMLFSVVVLKRYNDSRLP